MGDCNIRVITRFRPINAKEKEEWQGRDVKQIIKFVGKDAVEVAQPGQSAQAYTFDFVFDPSATQEEVYNNAAKLAVQDVLDGFNGTIFAYGQTGSGKSHSMMGPEGSLLEIPEQRGIIPRACCHIFDYINNCTEEGTEYTIKCSYLEIYNEMVMDLFDPKKQNLKIHESPSKGVWIADLTEEFVTCEQDVIDLLAIGGSNRATSSTNMNKVSSRSHSVFIMAVEQKTKDGSTKTGRLNLVDLAGSEKVGKTGATGQLLEEAKKINQSLSALGNCIHALTDSKKNKHVPYRDSKLTHILKESLGGNTKTCMLIACSPHEYNLEETISTLKFGQRAKTIKNSVKVNRQLSSAELQQRLDVLTKQITALQKHVVTLEQTIEFMKSPDYVPGKPLPANLFPKPIDGVAGGTGDLAKTQEGDGETDDTSYNPMALTEAQVELQKLKELTAVKIDDLTQELEFLKSQEDSHQRELDAKNDDISKMKTRMNALQMELQSVVSQVEMEAKRFEYQQMEDGFALESQQQMINELTLVNEELESHLAVHENERRQMEQTIAQLERKIRATGAGGSTEVEDYVAQLEDQVNKLRQEKAQLETQAHAPTESLEIKLREANAKIIQLQGQVDEVEARAAADQETILDELNVMVEKEAEMSNKVRLLEEENRQLKFTKSHMEAEKKLHQKQYKLLEEANKALKDGGVLLPGQLDGAIKRVDSLLIEISAEHTTQLKDLEGIHYTTVQSLQLHITTLQGEKQLAERKVKEQEAQANLNHTKTVTENKALKQHLEGVQEENKRLKQKLIALSSQTSVRSSSSVSLLGLTQETGDQVRSLESDLRSTREKLDTTNRQLAAEMSKTQISTKRIDQQANRLHELEERVSKMVKEQANLIKEAEDGKKAVSICNELKADKEVLLQEIEQLHIRSRLARISRPLKSKTSSILDGYREKIDFATVSLKSTGSKYLQDAREEAQRAEQLSKEIR